MNPKRYYNGVRLRELRKQRGLTLARLARMAGLSPASVWKIEKEVTADPGHATLVNLCRCLGVTLPEILHGPTEEDSASKMQAMFVALPPAQQQAMLIAVEQLLAVSGKKSPKAT